MVDNSFAEFEWKMTDKETTIASNDWTERYRPKTVKDIIGNKSQIYQITDWLDKYNTHRSQNKGKTKKPIKIQIDDDTEVDKIDTTEIDDSNIEMVVPQKGKKKNVNRSCLIATGDHGTGKTCTVMAILNDRNYEIYIINFSKLGNIKNIKDYVDKLIKGRNVCDIMAGRKRTKRAIVVDELESIVSPIEKTFVTMLLKQNELDWGCPVIFIANNHHNKLISTIKANSHEVKFTQPCNENMLQLLMKIYMSEKLKFPKSKEESLRIAQKIIDHSQNDYRRLVSILQDIKSLFSNSVISDGKLTEFIKLSKMKDVDYGIYGATGKLVYEYTNIDDTLRLYETDAVLMPLMIHQNYIKSIIDSQKHLSNAFKLANELSLSIARGDLIENYIYGDQNWDLREVHGYYSCVYPSYELSKTLANVPEIYKNKNNFIFPLDLNRTSIRRINKKNVMNASKYFKNMEISDYIVMNKIIRSLISVNEIDRCNELFDGYNSNISNIETVLKIDKIEGTKYNIPGAIRKKL